MVSYRFCRPDDMPLLCQAVNECFNVHLPGTLPLTVDGLRTKVKELNVWVSNAMVATEGKEPIGIMMGTKRPEEVLIHLVGVRQDYQRRGHARHMLTSLSQKLAVLGPERLIAEIPLDRPEVNSLFASAGYSRAGEPLTDYQRPRTPGTPAPEGLLLPTTVAELVDQGLLQPPSGAAWERTLQTLLNREESLQGLCIASPEQTEAFVLFRTADPPDEVIDILASGCRDPSRSELLLGILVGHLASIGNLPLRIPRLLPGEMDTEVLANLGFEPQAKYDRLEATATPL
ncbi:MAG: GNAT family N-acetyltransferase [Deltaproteobacteria bacterium]|nr:GNAT family N-acetyltransferase [Deltaproteobacteria bacterium]